MGEDYQVLEVSVPVNVFTEGKIDYLCQVLDDVPIWLDYSDRIDFRVAVLTDDIDKIREHFSRLKNKIQFSFTKLNNSRRFA